MCEVLFMIWKACVRTSSVVVQNRNSAVQTGEQRSVGDGKSDRRLAAVAVSTGVGSRSGLPPGVLQRIVVRSELAV